MVAPTVVPTAEDNRFLASATAPVAAGFAAVRVVVAGAAEDVVEDLEVVVADVFGGTVEEAVAGFLAAAVVAAVVLVLGLVGELGAPPTAVEVRLAVPVALEVGARFFSSSETEGRERCETVEAAVEAAVGGRLAAVVVAAGRVVGLVAVPALVRVAELVVELVADFVEVVPAAAGRRVAEVAGVVVVRFEVGVPVTGFFTAAPFGEAGVGAAAGAGAGASLCWTTSKPSASDMVGEERDASRQCEARSRVATGLLVLMCRPTVSKPAVGHARL